MRKPRLCIIVPHHWAAKMGGSQYQVKCLLEQLVPLERYEIFWLAGSCDPQYQPQGYSLVPLLPPGSSGRKFSRFLGIRRLWKQLKQIGPDLIYQRVGCEYTGIAAFYAKQHRCRMIWHAAHDDEVQPFQKGLGSWRSMRRFNKALLEYGIRHADAIVTQTEQQAELLERCYQRTPLRIVPNFHPLPKEKCEKDEPPKILWIGNFKPFKRPEYFIRLARELDSSRFAVSCLMIGAALNNEAKQALLEREMRDIACLSYLGARPLEEVNALLAGAAIFVNTSRAEGFPNTFIQAWMREVPVLSLQVNPDSVLERNQVGFCAHNNYDTLKEELLNLLDDPELRRTIGRRARKYAEEQHSLNKAEDLIRLFEDLLGGGA